MAQVAIRGQTIYTASGAPLTDATLVIQAGKITAIGKTESVKVPEGFEVLEAKVVTPGLIDAHCTVGLSGIFNVSQDQDQLEDSAPMQPELRALDAYNSQEELVSWVQSFGVTTLHTGHAPGELISGQTLVVKTHGKTVDQAAIVGTRAVAATLTVDARKSGGQSPGTRAKMMSMLRAELLKAREYRLAHAAATESAGTKDVGTKAAGSLDVAAETPKTDTVPTPAQGDKDSLGKEQSSQDPPAVDLRLETLAKVLSGELPLMITAHKAQDIANALRLAKEFQFKLWLDGAAEGYLLIDEIKAAGVPVIVHPTMARATGDLENMSFENAALLANAGIPIALQAGYEAYVPKTRVVLFEAAVAAANGLTFDQALAAVTIDAARILEIDQRVGSLEVGKDGDVALFDGDPFEYTTHCIGVVIDGQVVSRHSR